MSHKRKVPYATATVILVLLAVVLIHNRPWLSLVVTVGALITAVLAAWAIRRDKVSN
jgi:hypothetical protein